MKWKFDAQAVRQLPPSYDYGVFSRPLSGAVGTAAQRLEFAQRAHKVPHNDQEFLRLCRIILQGEDHDIVAVAASTWPNLPEVLAEWDRLDDNASKDEVSDGLPSKAKLGRDVYNLALDTSVDPDDRIKAFRLFGELQGHIGRAGSVINNNIDARSIILVPRRSAKVDDPEREEKVIQAQARLVSDAVRK
jgi:hypothetical protein